MVQAESRSNLWRDHQREGITLQLRLHLVFTTILDKLRDELHVVNKAHPESYLGLRILKNGFGERASSRPSEAPVRHGPLASARRLACSRGPPSTSSSAYKTNEFWLRGCVHKHCRVLRQTLASTTTFLTAHLRQ